MSEDRKIKILTLCFPHSATATECQEIARYAQKVVGAVVSEGGFVVKDGSFFMDGMPVKFADDEMQFVYGYPRETVSPKSED